MIRKIFLLVIVFALFSCSTIEKNELTKEDNGYTEENSVNSNEKPIISSANKNSPNVLELAETNVSNEALVILKYIQNKDWKEISLKCDPIIMSSYLDADYVDESDFVTYILHTAEKGLATNNTINNIENAFYTNYFTEGDYHIFEGLFIYKSMEEEYFKLKLLFNSSENCFVISE